jgi:RimJ/RimL family protein N-acetyltransferase
MKVEPVVLEGGFVRLEPLDDAHVPGLGHAGQSDDIWRYMPIRMNDEASASGWLQIARVWLAAQEGLAFATLDRETGEVVGSTAFLAASPPNLRVEIGATWVTPSRQRSPVNTEAKYLMLCHAFEVWRCNRVEFKTDSRNDKSRKALLRIGAREEGIWRNHMVMPDGHLRHSVYFSVLPSEWPEVKAALEARLAR